MGSDVSKQHGVKKSMSVRSVQNPPRAQFEKRTLFRRRTILTFEIVSPTLPSSSSSPSSSPTSSPTSPSPSSSPNNNNKAPLVRNVSRLKSGADFSQAVSKSSLQLQNKSCKPIVSSPPSPGLSPTLWPGTEADIAAFSLFHGLWKDILKGNFLVPADILDQGARVLLLTRDRVCAMDMAKTHPDFQIHCVDYLGIEEPALENVTVLPNCTFHQLEPGAPLPWPDEYFDLVGSRWLSFVFREENWPGHLKEMVRVTKSGGYIEHLNMWPYVYDTSSNIEQILISTLYAMRTKGRGITCAKTVHAFMKECHKITPYTSQKLRIPIGQWHDDPMWSEYGQRMLSYFMMRFRSGMNFYSKTLGVPMTKLEQDYDVMARDFAVHRSYLHAFAEVGRKI